MIKFVFSGAVLFVQETIEIENKTKAICKYLFMIFILKLFVSINPFFYIVYALQFVLIIIYCYDRATILYFPDFTVKAPSIISTRTGF